MLQKLEQEEQESTSLEEIIKANPLLLNSEDPDVIKVGEFYLPYSTGFEIECDVKIGVSKEDFEHIPNLLDLQITAGEQRFRIEPGIVGLQSLRMISDTLIEKALLNNGSGIHYHIDCTDVYDDVILQDVTLNKDWILKELDTWDYRGTYNSRDISFTNSNHTWIRFQSGFKTMEFRLGEMTFRYKLLFKRITHANDIVRRFKASLNKNVLSMYEDDYLS